ncbi:glycosyltransferase [Brenneria tiliae]|uniref:Glycosyltransferase family 4 protein n=1 Tax=Brenneria tiliae TaxID=2914984 RepID=A0ABT0MXT5_9GAMM|nr:glycosyltransferase [Brenneria tiliae]MCL2894650.1 glycosyltransferase family 4 protein [Brenneria tiliae]
MEKEILFITMHLPSPDVPEAGQKLVYSRLMKFIAENKKVHLVSFINERELSYLDYSVYEKCSSINFFKLKNINRLCNFLRKPWLPISIAVRNDNRMYQCVKKIITDNKIKDIHIEYEQGIVLIPSSLLPETTVVFHDIISQSIKRYSEGERNVVKKILLNMQLSLISRWEDNTLPYLREIVVLNKKDADLVTSKSINISKLSIDYPNVSESFFNVKRDSVEYGNIMFWGAMNRKENIDAVFWFVNSIFPKIVEKEPNVKFFIVGANPPESVIKLGNGNIIVTGFVENPVEYFERMQISVVPLRYGAGIKIKVLEALAARIPVVSTSVGAEGVTDVNGLLTIADDENYFAKKVICLFKKC